MVAAVSTPERVAFDSWQRRAADDEVLSDDRRARLLKHLANREHERGFNTVEERMIAALAWCGPTAPLDELAIKAGVSRPGSSFDSARKQGRRVIERLIARGLVVQRHERLPFAACTHVATKGTAGRLECQRLRKGSALTCVAHHGYTVRAFVAGLSPRLLDDGLAIPAERVTEAIRNMRAFKAEERRELGRQGNDAEGRAWRGESVKRGPRGTNHTSPRRTSVPSNVPPIPPEGSLGHDRSVSSDRIRGDKDDAPAAHGVDAASRRGTPTAGTSGKEGGRARTRPEREGAIGELVHLDELRRTRETVNWFVSLWTAHKLPGLNVLERRKTLWCRCRDFSRVDLQMGIAKAKRIAAESPAMTFRKVFGDPAVLVELVAEERRRRAPISRDQAGPRSLADQLAFFAAAEELAARGIDPEELL